MGWIQEAGRGIKERVLNTPGLRVLVLAIRNYILHQSAKPRKKTRPHRKHAHIH